MQIRNALSGAQFLSESISEKVKRSIEYKRSKNLYVGGVPYGYKLEDGKLVINDLEVSIMEKIKHINENLNKISSSMSNLQGTISGRYRYIIMTLKKNKITKFRNRPITKSTIETLLKRHKGMSSSMSWSQKD